MIDAEAIMFAILTKNIATPKGTNLFNEIGTRAWSPIPPAKSTWKNDAKAIIFHFEPDGNDAAGAIHELGMIAKCYGGSPDVNDAKTVYRVLYARLRLLTENTGAGKLMRAWRINSPGRLPPEPGTGWVPYVMRFAVHIEAA